LKDQANKDSRTGNHSPAAGDQDLAMERGAWISRWRIPRFLRRLLPSFAIRALHELKGKSIARDFPRDIEFEQSPDDRQASASMSIVVPIHDAPEITRRCLASLEKYAPESEVILVDDGSKLDETLELIHQFSGNNGWIVVRHQKSLGHSEACAAGAAVATRLYLCLLNSDTVATPWCWRRIAEVFEHDPTIAIAGPSTSVASTSQVLTLAANQGSYWNDNQICAFAERLLTQFQQPAVLDLPWVSGFAFFIRRSVWEQFGGFDPKIPDYGNEFELCSRVAEKGYRMVWVRDAYIHHFGGQSYAGMIGEEGIRARVQAADTYIKHKRGSPTP
jgi:GT2 family glycosyltransferase